MARPKRDATKAYTFRLPEQLMERIQEASEREFRPIGIQVEMLLEEGLAAHNVAGKAKGGGKR